MERHGDRLTLYLDGYLRDIHEAEDVMIEARDTRRLLACAV